jgi:hypothetical protein
MLSLSTNTHQRKLLNTPEHKRVYVSRKTRGRLEGASVVEPESLRGLRMELPVELVLENLLKGKVLLLDTDSAYQARLVRAKLRRLMEKKGINGRLVQVQVDDGGQPKYAIMLEETLRELLAEEEEDTGEAP